MSRRSLRAARRRLSFMPAFGTEMVGILEDMMLGRFELERIGHMDRVLFDTGSPSAGRCSRPLWTAPANVSDFDRGQTAGRRILLG